MKVHGYLTKLLVATSLVLLTCVFFSGQATAEMRIFELQHQPASGLAEIVRTLVGDDSKIAFHKNTLVVNASQDVLDEVAKLVISYDLAQRMVRITVEQGNSLVDKRREIRTSGRLQNNSVTIGLNGADRDKMSSIQVNSGRNRINAQGQDRSLKEKLQVRQFMMVMEGSPARISVGRAVPFTSQMLAYCRRHPKFIETITYHNVDTGFEVLPEVSGNMAQLEIRPFMSFLDKQNPNQIVFQELSTQVRIPVGTWYELGGNEGSQDGLSREILGGGRHSVASENSIRIRVDLE